MRVNSQSLTNLKKWTGLDRAILYSLIGRGWSACAGVTTIFLIAHFLSRGEQGFYYTFASLAAAQVVFELGFSFVILQLAAHERVNLQVSRDGSFVAGSDSYSRLASVLKQAVRWYAVAGLLMGTSLAVGGIAFFRSRASASNVGWLWPWLEVVLLTTVTFLMDPVISFLEGCGKVVQVGKLRVQQSMLGTLLAWVALLCHHGLHAPAMLILGEAIFSVKFLFDHRRVTWPLLRSRRGTVRVSWSTEIWPFQWRIAVSWVSSYCTLQLMNPILFATIGPVPAGQMGMSIAICNALGNVALSWITTKAAPFGGLIAKSDFKELDRIFFRALMQSTGLLAVLSLILLAVLASLVPHFPVIAARIIPLRLFALLLLTVNCTHVVISQAYYLRAHKKEPFLFVWVLLALLALGSMTVLAPKGGLLAVTLSYALIAGLLRAASSTFVFIRCRKDWHSTPTIAGEVIPQA